MRIDVSNALKNPGQSYPLSARVELPPMEVLDDPVRFEDVQIAGDLVGDGESVSVRAIITATVRSRCAKCLVDVERPLRVEVEERFAKETPREDDADSYPLDGSHIEMDDLVRDALLLELPIRFLCKRDCRGLCPVCGGNLNEKRCTCLEGGERQNPFSALRTLLDKDEEV